MNSLKKKKIDINYNTNEWRKVGFIGISNWVLDPAKMNRGIFVNRCSPDIDELKQIASGICKNDEKVINIMEKYLPSLANAYIELCELTRKYREFFGLRDFYSLIKMIYYEIKEKSGLLDMDFLEKAIRRNFGGLVFINPLEPFMRQFHKDRHLVKFNKEKANVIELIREALTRRNDRKTVEGENRYLLLLAQNENALDLLNNYILEQVDIKNTRVIFGSSFPNDQHYSQICRQIHQIKLSMELGKTVILLNLESLYESLYDALNQFYYRFGDNEKFVDLGLGTQRVKCLVHDDFRLIVVADKNSVYDPKRFPIPLVNRLEKHCLSVASILNERKVLIVRSIQEWCSSISTVSTTTTIKESLADIFIGFTDDTIASLTLKVCQENNFDEIAECDEYAVVEVSTLIIDRIKCLLLQCATSDAIIRLDQQQQQQRQENVDVKTVSQIYFYQQSHNSFGEFLNMLFLKDTKKQSFIQITTHSKLLSSNDIAHLSKFFHIKIESLLAFNTQQQFVEMLNTFFKVNQQNEKPSILVIQCDCANYYSDLVSSARYCIVDQLIKEDTFKLNDNIYIMFIIQVPKISGGCFSGFQTAQWFCYHIDDLQDDVNIGNIYEYKETALSKVFENLLPEQHDTIKNETKRISLIRILESSIYSICSKVVDVCKRSQDEVVVNRCVKRVELLMSLFRNENSKFMRILIKLISKLQHEKEVYSSTPQRSKTWIYNEVARLQNIMKYGTLKISCRNYIEGRLTILLAGLIAFLDTNQNFNILFESEKDWIQDFWLGLFEDENFIDFKYEKFYLQSNGHEKVEFNCIDYRINGAEFQLKLPFSWLIKEFIDNLIAQHNSNFIENNNDWTTRQIQIDESFINVTNNPFIIFEQISNVFKSSPQYLSFISLLKVENRQEFFRYYVNDYLILTYSKIINKNHLNVVYMRIKSQILSYYTKNFNDMDVLIALHMSFDDLKKELELLSQFIEIDCGIADTLVKNEELMGSNLCFLASKILCKKFTKLNAGMDQKSWTNWLEDIAKTSHLIDDFIQVFINSPKNNMNLVGQDHANSIAEFKSLWERSITLKLFIENVCKDTEKLYKHCIRLWNLLKDPIDYKKQKSIKELINFLNIVIKASKNQYKLQLKKCAGCMEDNIEVLRKPSKCQCALCKICVGSFENSKRCPGCNVTIDHKKDALTFTIVQDNDAYKQEYLTFKTNCDTFFLDIVSTLCLNDNILPENEVIEILIEQIMPKLSSDAIEDVDFNLNPTIKSTLLQLLLNYSSSEVETALENLFSKSALFLRNTYKYQDIMELNLMYINAFEDSLYSTATDKETNTNLFADAELAIELFKKLTYSNNNENQISQLRSIAEIRFCLVTCSRFVNDFNSNNVLQKALMNEANDFMDVYPSEWPKYFILKQVFRRYGKSVLTSTNKFEELKWIIPEFLINELTNVIILVMKFYTEYNFLFCLFVLSIHRTVL
jgi:hypothetical protein